MKVKIADRIYDAEDTPIMLIMSGIDKMHIKQMPLEAYKYACMPESMTDEEKEKFMKVDE